MAIFLYFLFLISSVSAACQTCVHESKASYFASNVPLSYGSCGYGYLAPGFSNGYVGAGVSSVYRDGVGCGACFQIRCKDAKLCNGKGTNVILTDSSSSNETHFVLSSKAFLGMARKGMGNAILKRGMVDIEYKRVPCEYKNKNLSVRVEEMSQKPDHLVLKFLYQGGQTDILGVEIVQEGRFWKYISVSREHGAVWEIVAAPTQPLLFKIHVLGGFDAATITAQKPIPADWKVGEIYDLGVQINDISYQDVCHPCADNEEEWH